MSYGQFESRRGSPFTGLADPRSIYRNPQYEEALATLRDGIEARKGLILCTGEAGTGKSTLLQEFAREQSANVTCALISDPHLSFAEIIRSILRRLQVEPESTAEPALLRQWRTLMRSQSETGGIISVAFDNAHHLHDKVLEQVLHDFVGAGPRDSQKHLAQIVLAGRPKLKERLFRPPLRSLGSPLLAIECRLPTLNDKEIGEYIEHQLRAAHLPVDLFGHDAIQRIAVYSGGNLRHVNAICDRVFQATDASSRKQITAALIETAVKDLDLWQPRWINTEKPEMDFTLPKERDEPFGFGLNDNDTTEVVGQTFLNYAGVNSPARSHLSRDRRGTRLSILLILLALAGTVAWLQGKRIEEYLATSLIFLSDVSRPDSQFSAPTKTDRNADSVVTQELANSAPTPASDFPASPADEHEDGTISPSDISKRDESSAAVPSQPPPITNPDSARRKIPLSANQKRLERRPATPLESADIQRKRLEIEVSNAIENRAIAGIAVSVIDEIIYLDGRVATERQRNAAERAARSVAGVEKVRNRIVVNRG